MTASASPTLEQFISVMQDIQPAAKAVLMARVFAQMERERVTAYTRPIFDRYAFTVAARFLERGLEERITDPERIYLSDDEPGVAAYFADCDDAHRAHGFTGPAGHCPALTAEYLQIRTEQALIELACPLFDIEAHQLIGDARAKFLELVIGAAMKGEPTRCTFGECGAPRCTGCGVALSRKAAR